MGLAVRAARIVFRAADRMFLLFGAMGLVWPGLPPRELSFPTPHVPFGQIFDPMLKITPQGWDSSMSCLFCVGSHEILPLCAHSILNVA